MIVAPERISVSYDGDNKLFINNIIRQIGLRGWDVLAILFVLCVPTLAFAVPIEGTSNSGAAGGSVSTLGAMFSGSCQNIYSLANLFDYVAYGAGCAFTVIGINNLRLHTEHAANHPLNKALMMFAGAAFLMTLPTILVTVATSLGYAVSATMATCVGAGASGGAGTGLDGMMANFVTNIRAPLIVMVQVIANVAGVFMMVHGLIQASKYGYDARTNSIHKILTNIGFGAILFTIGGNFSMMMASLFGTSSVTDPSANSVLSWSFVSATGGGSQQFATAIAAALQFIQIIGFIAFVRGWLVMKKVVEGGGNVTMAQGITHIVGGVLAINIFQFLTIMNKTFGTNLL